MVLVHPPVGEDDDVSPVAVGPVHRNEQVVQQLIDLVGGKPVYFVTIRMPYPNQEKNNNSMMRAAASHNGNVGIIDWYKYSEGHGEYLYDDGIHPNMTGAYAYATMLRQAVCGQ